jgi:hypothetical protein
MEEWKDITGQPGYMVSNIGRVKSFKFDKEGKIRKLSFDKYGYLQITLRQKAKITCFRIHRLVASCFIDNPMHKAQVNHIDGDKTNNRFDNLEWVTDSENRRHAIMTGLINQKGENNHEAKLTKDQVLSIREMPGRYKAIAEEFGIGKSTVGLIKTRRTWKWL